MTQVQSLAYETPRHRPRKPGLKIAIGIIALAVGLFCAAGCIYSLFQSRSAMERVGAVDAQAAKRFPARPSPAMPPGATRFIPRSDLPPLESSATSQADQIEHFLISLNQRERGSITAEQLGVLKSLILNRARELAQQREDWARSGIKNHWVGYAIMQQHVTLEVKLNRNDPEAYWVLPDCEITGIVELHKQR